MPVLCRLVACLLIGSLVALSACSTGPEVDVTIHESPQGAVYLERIADRSFQAAHPIKIDSNTIALVMGGVLVRDDQGALQNFFAGKPDARRAFSDNEVAYLAPLISDGLKRAAADQQVGFRVEQIGAPGYSERVGAGVGSSEPPLTLHPRESTTGTIYAYGRSLYLTLTQYRYRQEPATTINMANRRIPDATGLVNHTVSFVPEAAKRPDSYHDARSTDKTLVIDYELLARLHLYPVDQRRRNLRPRRQRLRPRRAEKETRQRRTPTSRRCGRNWMRSNGNLLNRKRLVHSPRKQFLKNDYTTLFAFQPVLRAHRLTAPLLRSRASIFANPCFAAESA